jgi:hypothetical protein
VYRLYREEGLAMRIRQRRRMRWNGTVTRPAAARPNELWSIDFLITGQKAGNDDQGRNEWANHKSGEQTASEFSHAFKFIMGYPQALCGELSSPRPAQNASLICRLPGCPLTLLH